MKKIKTKKHQLSWVKGLTLGMVLVTQPAFSQTLPPLTNENNLPIPSPNITSLSSVLPTYTPGNPFTGTWSLPVASSWLGTFSGTGNSILDNTVSGTTTDDFTTGLGQLPIGTYSNFADVDGGAGGGEISTLQAVDSSNNQIVELCEPSSSLGLLTFGLISFGLFYHRRVKKDS